MTPFGTGDLPSEFLRNAVFYCKDSVAQLELIPGYLDSLLEFGELESPLDLIKMKWSLTIT